MNIVESVVVIVGLGALSWKLLTVLLEIAEDSEPKDGNPYLD